MRGRMTRACGKAKWRIELNRKLGGCTLSRKTVAMINKKKPDRRGGIMCDLDHEQTQCDCRPGGVLRSVCGIGTGVAGTSGEAGTPNFESVSRPLAGAGMLPQGRLAGEQFEPNRHVVVWVGSHLFLCYRFVFRLDRNHCGSSSIYKSHWFPHGSGAYPWEGFLVSTR